MDNREHMMLRALELAANGRGAVAPNPMVGCVILHNDKIIGEGYHRQFGGPHAEVNAIASVRDHSLLKESTLFVTLEPCSHQGKTPPCSQLILEKEIPHVIIASKDPNSEVRIKGIEQLRQAGVNVEVGICEQQAAFLNRRFYTFHQEKRPYVILKWAQTADGFIDVSRQEGSPPKDNWITSPASKTLVHQWRSQEQAILVGANTAINDDPALTVREVSGANPLRLVIDPNGRIGHDAKLFDGSVPTIVYGSVSGKVPNNVEAVAAPTGREMIPFIMEDLYQRGIQSLIVEGGKTVLELFLAAAQWDEARVFTGTKEFGSGLSAPQIDIQPAGVEASDTDQIHYYYRQ